LIGDFNRLTGKHFTPDTILQPIPLISLLLFAVLVSFFAGVYPAIILSGTQVMGCSKKVSVSQAVIIC
jgi:putative ABC transport system permease protein